MASSQGLKTRSSGLRAASSSSSCTPYHSLRTSRCRPIHSFLSPSFRCCCTTPYPNPLIFPKSVLSKAFPIIPYIERRKPVLLKHQESPPLTNCVRRSHCLSLRNHHQYQPPFTQQPRFRISTGLHRVFLSFPFNMPSTKMRSRPQVYPRLAFHIIRAIAFISAVIVSGILTYFCIQLKHDGFKLPWTFIVVRYQPPTHFPSHPIFVRLKEEQSSPPSLPFVDMIRIESID